MQPAGQDGLVQRLAGCQQVLLADVFFQPARPHAVGQGFFQVVEHRLCAVSPLAFGTSTSGDCVRYEVRQR